MTKHDQWPIALGLPRIQIFGQNLNGILKQNDYAEWELMFDHLESMQIDISCLTEINSDITKPAVKLHLKIAKKYVL